MVVGFIHEPEAANRGETLQVRNADEAENDHTEQDPWGMSRKEGAEGTEHVIQIMESKHTVPPV
jgi:hypothetical protein